MIDLALAFLLFHFSAPTSSSAAEPPNPDLARVEAPVRDLVEKKRQAVLESPDSAEAWGRLGMAFDIHDFETEAERCYDHALELEPEDFRWAYFRALTLADMADERAPEAFAKALGLRPSYAPLLVRYGDLLLELGLRDEAERRYRSAIEADGEGMAQALLGLARLAVADGDLEAATGYGEQAAAADPRHGPIHGFLAEIYRRRGKTRKAAEAREQAEEARGPSVLVDELVGELMEGGVSSYWHHQRGQFLLASGQLERAETELRAAIALSPHALFYENLARALARQRRHGEAEAALKEGLKLAPDLASSLLMLGRLYIRDGRPEEAVPPLRRAAELRPDSPASRDLGYQLLALDERLEGIRWLEKALANDEDPRILLTVAFFYGTTPHHEARDGEKAETFARRLLELAGHRPESYDALGAALAAQGRFEEAIEAAERAFELAQGGGSPLVLRMRQRLELYHSRQPFIAPR